MSGEAARRGDGGAAGRGGSSGGGMIFPDAALLWIVWVGSAVVWLGLSVVVVRRWRVPRAAAPWLILGVAAAVRVGYVALMPPSLSDDVWRYVFDGRTLVDGGNPYAVVPGDVREAAKARGGEASDATAWMDWINNPELVTIYQPVSQYVFAGATLLTDWFTGFGAGEEAPGGWSAEKAERVYRLVFSGFDLVIVLMLLGVLRSLGRSAWWAVLYAWNPLVVAEVAWSGHQDGIGIAFMVASLIVAQRSGRSWAAAVGAGVLLGLAAGVKPIVLPLALPLAWRLVRDAGWVSGLMRTAAAGAACAATIAAAFVPFLLMEGGIEGMLDTSGQFVGKWRFNGSVHALLEHAFGGPAVESAKARADAIAGGLLLLVLLIGTFAHRTPWRAATTYLFAMVCLSSTAHPWYLLWAAALMPVAWASGKSVVSPAVWVASLTLPWSYVAWLNYASGGAFDGEYQPGLAVTWAVWVPVYLAVVWGAWRVVVQTRAEQRGDTDRPAGGRG
ncbi:MAG: hypothetical protein AAFX76_07655 [Planctomycetota bacterium]